MFLKNKNRIIQSILAFSFITFLWYCSFPIDYSLEANAAPSKPTVAPEGGGGGGSWGSNPNYSTADVETINKGFKSFYKEWKGMLVFLSAIALLTTVLTFIWLMIRLSASADNPFERSKVLKEILVICVTAGILGGIPMIYMLVFTIAFK